jgi:hypothetical protein
MVNARFSLLHSCKLDDHIVIFPAWSAYAMQTGFIIDGRQAGDRKLLEMLTTCEDWSDLPHVSFRRNRGGAWRHFNLGSDLVAIDFGPKNGRIEISDGIRETLKLSILLTFSACSFRKLSQDFWRVCCTEEGHHLVHDVSSYPISKSERTLSTVALSGSSFKLV